MDDEFATANDFADIIMERLEDYNPEIHCPNEWESTIEIKNKTGDSLFIHLDNEIIIEFKHWHSHYDCYDFDDLDIAMEKVENILNNEGCIISIYTNDEYCFTGSSLNKSDYTKDEVVDFIKSFCLIHYYRRFNEQGVTAKLYYWDSTKDKDIVLEKGYFHE